MGKPLDDNDPNNWRYYAQLVDSVHFCGSKMSVVIAPLLPPGYGVHYRPAVDFSNAAEMSGLDGAPPFAGFGELQEADTQMIRDTVETYARVVERYYRMGFDLCTIHASYQRYINEPGPLASFVTQYDFDACVIDENDPLTFTMAFTQEFGPGISYMYIAHAIDYESAAAAGFGSLYTSVSSILPASVNYYVDTGMPYTYDVDLAKELLAQSACPDGFDLHVVTVNSGENINIMTVIQAYLANIGINISIESYDIPTAVPHAAERGDRS